MRPANGQPRTAHLIVVGNEKGGTGKTTVALHIAVALLRAGHRVATIDTDGRQLSLTRAIENRRRSAARMGAALALPWHQTVEAAGRDLVREGEAVQYQAFLDAVNQAETDYDFIVVDTPGAGTYLMRLCHAVADTLVTPINDSFLDFDVLGQVEPRSLAVLKPSHYAELVQTARDRRRRIDGVLMDWVVVRNRLSTLDSRNNRRVANGLDQLAAELHFRIARGISERVVYREFFPRGLTAADVADRRVLGAAPTVSQLAAGSEVRELIEALRLPIDERGRDRQERRRAWQEEGRSSSPETPTISALPLHGRVSVPS